MLSGFELYPRWVPLVNYRDFREAGPRAEEPIFVNSKWASDTFAYQNPSQKPFG